MCQSSRLAKKSVDATQGATLGISTIGLDDGTSGRVGALHAVGEKASDCVHCVQTNQQLTLSNIPMELQNKFGIGATAIATFQESTKYHADDVLDFGNGRRVQFRQFADQGIEVYVGVKDKAGAVEQLISSALAGATKVDEGAGFGTKRELVHQD